MSKELNRGTKEDGSMDFNVRLQPIEGTGLPVLANHTHVNVAQGVACLTFGYIEPIMLAELGKLMEKNGTLPNNVRGSLTARIALPLGSIHRLHQQLSQVLIGLGSKPAQ